MAFFLNNKLSKKKPCLKKIIHHNLDFSKNEKIKEKINQIKSELN